MSARLYGTRTSTESLQKLTLPLSPKFLDEFREGLDSGDFERGLLRVLYHSGSPHPFEVVPRVLGERPLNISILSLRVSESIPFSIIPQKRGK